MQSENTLRIHRKIEFAEDPELDELKEEGLGVREELGGAKKKLVMFTLMYRTNKFEVIKKKETMEYCQGKIGKYKTKLQLFLDEMQQLEPKTRKLEEQYNARRAELGKLNQESDDLGLKHLELQKQLEGLSE